MLGVRGGGAGCPSGQLPPPPRSHHAFCYLEKHSSLLSGREVVPPPGMRSHGESWSVSFPPARQ